MRIGDKELDLRTTAVMSIINVTPDSFYAASRNISGKQVAQAVDSAVEEGADILDIGGYSSRPGAEDVTPEDEFSRLSIALDYIAKNYQSLPVSIDTFRANVARRCLDKYGPCIINDISAGDLDPDMHRVATQYGVPYIAMHMRSTPAEMQWHTKYGDVTDEVLSFFKIKLTQMHEAGIRDENIILDPGFGFAKTTRQNYELMKRLNELVALGYPVLSGVSRKSMIYKVLEVEPQQALTGTIALNWESLTAGASILRVHDTAEAVQVVKLFEYYKNA